jgi:glycine betaine/choline ABC-type transport system substrate-binding protein
MGRMVERRDFLCATCLRWLWAVWANPGRLGSAVQVWTAKPAGAAIAVGSFDFPESVLLAYIYTEALATRGFPVPVLPNLGVRELVHRALMNGLVQLVPGHAGLALDLVSRGRRTQALIPEGRGGQ